MRSGPKVAMTTSARPPRSRGGRSWVRGLQVGVVLIALAVVQLGLDPIKATAASTPVGSSGPPVVRVSGDRLVNGAGTPIRLIGVDQAGAESACVEGAGFGIPGSNGDRSLFNGAGLHFGR